MKVCGNAFGVALAVLVVVAMLGGACGPSETPSTAPTGNQPPEIASLTAAQTTIHPSGSVEVRCAASDADDASVSFKWACTGGSFSGDGPTVTWQAPPNYGTYTITVTVEDSKGGSAQASLPLTVGANQSPGISELVANPSAVLYGESVTVRCVANDPDGDVVDYTWSASGGDISGVGDTVTWVAPNKGGDFYIKVVVSDGKGGETESNVMVTVSTVTRTVTITPVAEETGTVDSNGDKDNSRTMAGDDANDVGYCAYWSFNVWDLAGEKIQSASLDFGPYEQVGNPFSSTTGLGGMRLWKVTYGDKLPSFEYTGSNLINVPLQTKPPTKVDVTQEITNMAAAASKRFQVKALFQNKKTNGNHVAEFVEWSEVVLEVTYSEK